MTKTNDDTFLRITNADIYAEIKQLRELSENNHKITEQKLSSLEKHVVETNGKVKLSKWIATTGLSVTLILLGILFQHLRG